MSSVAVFLGNVQVVGIIAFRRKRLFISTGVFHQLHKKEADLPFISV